MWFLLGMVAGSLQGRSGTTEMAGGSLPPGFPLTEIDGQHYWDGGSGSTRRSPTCCRRSGPRRSRPPPAAGSEIFIVDVFPQQFVAPDNPLPTPSEVQARVGQLIYQDKTRSDASGSQWVPGALRDPGGLAVRGGRGLAAPLRERRQKALTDFAEANSRVPVTVTHIQRASMPYEQISCRVDFSADRIAALIEQGERDARRAVA